MLTGSKEKEGGTNEININLRWFLERGYDSDIAREALADVMDGKGSANAVARAMRRQNTRNRRRYQKRHQANEGEAG